MEKDIAFSGDSEKSINMDGSVCESVGYDLSHEIDKNMMYYKQGSVNSKNLKNSASLSNTGVGIGIGNPNSVNGIVNQSPWVVSTWGNNESYLDETKSVYELKLVGGTRIVKEFGWRDIIRVEETEDEHQKKSLTVSFRDGDVVNVACSIRMFMSLIKKKYNSWAAGTIMEQIANGTDA